MTSLAIAVIVIAVLAVLVLALAVVLVGQSRRRKRLQETFGPEYDRTVERTGDERSAEHVLTARERRVRSLDIRELPEADRQRYADEWARAQACFVDDPGRAVGDADALVTRVMGDRGYPTEGYDQQVADLSVEHAGVLDNYRAAHDISTASARGAATTEDLRQAMVHYRALFADLLGGEVVDPYAGQEQPGGTPAVSSVPTTPPPPPPGRPTS